MITEQYPDPKYPQRTPKIAYVIAGYLHDDCQRDYIAYKENKLETYRFNMACHKHYEAGMEYSIVFIDNGSNSQEGIHLMKDNGMYFRRENSGFSFGAWKYAYQMLDNLFDYYLFTEDDHVPCKDGWLKDIFDTFHSEPNIGALGNFMETRGRGSKFEIHVFDLAKNSRDIMHNLDGGWTFTSTAVLNDIYRRGGGMVIDPRYQNTENELLFQTPMLECGYKVKAYIGHDDFSHYFIHGSSVVNPGKETESDLSTITPLINCNGRFKHDKLKTYFSWYNK